MTVRFKHREFESEAELRLYMIGYNAYPNWPQVGHNGAWVDAPQHSLPATGWYDADEEQMARDEAKRDRAEREFSGESEE